LAGVKPRDAKGNERLLQAWKEKESTRTAWACCCVVTQEKGADEAEGHGAFVLTGQVCWLAHQVSRGSRVGGFVRFRGWLEHLETASLCRLAF